MLELCARSLADTHAIAAALAGLARAGDIVLLSGEMGSGKTAFAQGFGRALGITEPITSPTFTLVHSYPVGVGKLTLHHADLYRLDRTAEVTDLALDELAEFGGIVLVEWGDVVEGAFPDHLTVHLSPDDDDADDDDADAPTPGEMLEAVLDASRRIEIAATGTSWAGRWDRIAASLEGFRC
jgi:tRNA threonylcarbamoyladenosine biosynthesis protein TsaE